MNSMVESSVRANPFIGIRPYRESEHKDFRGRIPEVDLVLRIMETTRVTVLTGDSGCGKTSLLRAGVMPALRRQWEANRPRVGLPLIIRSWGETKGVIGEMKLAPDVRRLGVELLFANILLADNPTVLGFVTGSDDNVASDGYRTARERLQEAQFAHEKESLRLAQRSLEEAIAIVQNPASPQGSGEQGGFQFEDLIWALSSVCGGIVLIFDQVEELLRAGKDATDQFSMLVARLAMLDNVRLMLSLRSEHLAALRHIEGNLSPEQYKVYYMKDLPPKKLKETLKDIGRTGNVELGDDLLDRLTELESHDSLGSASLYFFQAILKEIWENLRNDDAIPSGTGILQLGCDALDRIAPTLRDNNDASNPERAPTGEDYLVEAVKRMMTRAFTAPPGHPTQQREVDVLRFVVVRVMPWLSSGGYKTTVGETDLFNSTLRDLDWKQPENGGEEQRRTLLTASLTRLKSDETRPTSDEYAVLKNYSAAYLSGDKRQRTYWELVHDRLGIPLLKWADEVRNRSDDAKASPAICRGVSPIKITKPQTAKDGPWEDLQWLGCAVMPDRSVRKTRKGAQKAFDFTGIVFANCNFNGTIFEDCTFQNCEFRDCNLTGALFIGCEFRSCKFTNVVERLNDHRSLCFGMLGVTVQEGGIEFIDLDLVQPTFRASALLGDVLFSSCRVQQARFLGDPKGECRFIIDARCEGGYNYWEETLDQRLESRSNKLRLPAGKNVRLEVTPWLCSTTAEGKR